LGECRNCADPADQRTSVKIRLSPPAGEDWPTSECFGKQPKRERAGKTASTSDGQRLAAFRQGRETIEVWIGAAGITRRRTGSLSYHNALSACRTVRSRVSAEICAQLNPDRSQKDYRGRRET
jgi:hypothetical protein